MVAKRFDVYLASLDPTLGSEIDKARPCMIVSPDEINDNTATVIVAPMTTQGKLYRSRVPCTFQGKEGRVVLDQLRTVVKLGLVRRIGSLSTVEQNAVLLGLADMFAR